MRYTFAFAAAIVAAGLVSVSSAFAHVTLEVREAPADSSYKAVFTVPHGCEASPTTRVRVRLPDGVTGVKPQPHAGWELSMVKAKLDKPLTGGHGESITEMVTEVVWSGGKLSDEHFDTFAVRMSLPKASAGTVLYFPVVQECEKGVNRWIEIPEAGKTSNDYKQPAPSLRLIAKP